MYPRRGSEEAPANHEPSTSSISEVAVVDEVAHQQDAAGAQKGGYACELDRFPEVR